MRCDAGELAIIDTSSGEHCKCYVGLPIDCWKSGVNLQGKAVWILQTPLATCIHQRHIGTHIHSISDEMLRPIRPKRNPNPVDIGYIR